MQTVWIQSEMLQSNYSGNRTKWNIGLSRSSRNHCRVKEQLFRIGMAYVNQQNTYMKPMWL